MSHYDEEMLAAAALALSYLQSPRGQAELRRRSEAAREIMAGLRACHELSQEQLNQRYGIAIGEVIARYQKPAVAARAVAEGPATFASAAGGS